MIHRRLRNVKPRVLDAKIDGKHVKLEKHVIVKVIIGKLVSVKKFTAPAGKGYSEDDIWEIRAGAIDRLDQKFPMFEFNEVEVGRNQINYIMCGVRQGMLPQQELNDGQANKPDAVKSLGEQIAAALTRGSAEAGDGSGGEGQRAGDASDTGSGAAEDSGERAESAEDASTAEANLGEHPARGDRQEDLQDQGPRDQGDRAANDADDTRGESSTVRD